MPELSVAGFAGPGDPLANPAKTFETMALLKERHPDLILCVSTNGLTLSRHLDDLVSLGVQYVTVTVNALEPTVAEKIYPWVYAEKKRWKGLSGAKLLLEKQREGIEAVIGAGLFCKINSVLIPEVNDAHLTEVNQFVSGLGVYMHNIMPLISDPIHGTVFGLQGVPSATAEQVEAVRDTCEGRARVMRHCRQCRADAVGLLGA
jgi:nitrogen fixation protein NifB